MPTLLRQVKFPIQLSFHFISAELFFFLLYLWTVIRSKEYSPAELKYFSETERTDTNVKLIHVDPVAYAGSNQKWSCVGFSGIILVRLLFILFYTRMILDYMFFLLGSFLFGLLQLFVGFLSNTRKN